MLAQMAADPDLTQLRRRAGWVLVGGLCVAAAVAIVALLVGSFGDTEARVVGTSLGFSVFASTAAAGAALRLRSAPWARGLGAATSAASLVSFVLLTTLLWVEDDEAGAALLDAFAVAALAALWTSHASLLLGAVRPADSPLIRRLTATAIGSLGVDSAVGMLAILGALDDVDPEFFARGLAVLVVLALLSTILLPLLRRLARARPEAAQAEAAAAFGAAPRPPTPILADEVAQAAERLAGMPLPPEARAEVARLRARARDASE
jgi:hypothetical protein